RRVGNRQRPGTRTAAHGHRPAVVRDHQRPGRADDRPRPRQARPARQVRRSTAPRLVRDAKPVPHRRDGRRPGGGGHPVRLPRRPPPPRDTAARPDPPPSRPAARPAPHQPAGAPAPGPLTRPAPATPDPGLPRRVELPSRIHRCRRARIRAGTAARPVTGRNRSEAALSAAYSLSDSSISAAATLLSSCPTLDAPGIAVTDGCRITQASAIWAGSAP